MNIQILKDEYLEHLNYFRGYTSSTIRRHKTTLKLFIRAIQAEKLSDFNNDSLRQAFYKGRTESKWTPGTFRNYLATLSVFFQWCIKNGHMKTNPVLEIEKPKTPKSLPKNLKKQEILKLLEYAMNSPIKNRFLRIRNHAIIATFAYTGIRKNELVNLKIHDVDIENKSLFVRLGKGSKDRIIPLNFNLVAILEKYLEERNKRSNCSCPSFFLSGKKFMGITPELLNLFAKDLRKSTGINFTLHRLRHSFATMMLEGGCDIYSLSKMMGHSDIKTTTVYLNTSYEQLRTQITKHPLNIH